METYTLEEIQAAIEIIRARGGRLHEVLASVRIAAKLSPINWDNFKLIFEAKKLNITDPIIIEILKRFEKVTYDNY